MISIAILRIIYKNKDFSEYFALHSNIHMQINAAIQQESMLLKKFSILLPSAAGHMQDNIPEKFIGQIPLATQSQIEIWKIYFPHSRS